MESSTSRSDRNAFRVIILKEPFMPLWETTLPTVRLVLCKKRWRSWTAEIHDRPAPVFGPYRLQKLEATHGRSRA